MQIAIIGEKYKYYIIAKVQHFREDFWELNIWELTVPS